MNHDGELKVLGMALKRTIRAFTEDIGDIHSAKHRSEQIRELEKAVHYMLKMSEKFDDINEWLTAFGPGSEYQ